MKFCIDDSCFTCGINLLEVIRETTVIVLTFQLAMQSAGNFLLFLCGLLDAVLNSPLVEYFILSFLHAKKQADRGGSAPYWFGTAQLWRVVSDQ